MTRFLYILPFALSALLFGQPLADTTWQKLPLPANRLTRIPLPARKQAAKLILPGEPGPRESYIIVAILSATQDNDGSHQALEQLQAMAMSNGCDVLWVQSFQVYSEQRKIFDAYSDKSDYYYNQYTMLGIIAYGIRYQSTLPDLSPVMQVQRWEAYDSTGHLTALRKELLANGNPVMEAGYFPPELIRFTEQISPLSLIYEKFGNWKVFKDETTGNIRRKVDQGSGISYRFMYGSGSYSRVKEIEVSEPNTYATSSTFGPSLILGYDTKERVQSVTTTRQGMGKIRLEVAYLGELSWSRIDCWRLGPDDKPLSRWYSIYFTPATAADLQQFMAKEDIHQP